MKWLTASAEFTLENVITDLILMFGEGQSKAVATSFLPYVATSTGIWGVGSSDWHFINAAEFTAKGALWTIVDNKKTMKFFLAGRIAVNERKTTHDFIVFETQGEYT